MECYSLLLSWSDNPGAANLADGFLMDASNIHAAHTTPMVKHKVPTMARFNNEAARRDFGNSFEVPTVEVSGICSFPPQCLITFGMRFCELSVKLPNCFRGQYYSWRCANSAFPVENAEKSIWIRFSTL